MFLAAFQKYYFWHFFQVPFLSTKVIIKEVFKISILRIFV